MKLFTSDAERAQLRLHQEDHLQNELAPLREMSVSKTIRHLIL